MTSLLFIAFLAIPVLLVLGLSILRYKSEQRINKRVRNLFLKSDNHVHRTFTHASINNLPEPVQRYFKTVLKEGQPYINCIRLRHTGKFKTNLHKDWVNITGEEYFTTVNPGMLWIGRTKWFTAVDAYIGGKGSLTVWLLSVVKIADSHGVKYTQGELLRWLGESVWFPTNLLPGENLRWTAIDNNTARLNFTLKSCTVFYIVTFGESGEITQLETKRYMGDKNLETWIGRLSDYRKHDGVLIPTLIEAAWNLEGTEFPYARFEVSQIEYGKPGRYPS